MEVILKQDVEHLGFKDDLLRVKDGYARNYLIPKGYALTATEPNKKMLAETLKQRAFKEEKIKEEAQAIADALKDVVVKVGAKVSSKGKIFGSVTTLQVAEAIKKSGHEVDRKCISIKEDAIKNVGTYTANIRFHRDIIVDVQFEVVEE